MDWVNPALLAGASLAVVPVVLHLVMRQRPRHLEFPALRFIQRRQDANRRRLKLRHLLLLLLRMAAIGLLAAALARPSIKASGVIGDQAAPVAAALVFDTSPRMDYRHENQTRLEAAAQIALGLVKEFPLDSEVAVVDSSRGDAVFQVDAGAARQRIERLETAAVGRPLAESLGAALELVQKSELERKEVYLFTDLTRGAWAAGPTAALTDRLRRSAAVGIYLIDVGVEQARNLALGEVRLSSQVLARNKSWTIGTELASLGSEGRRTVEVHLLDAQGKPQKRAQETLEARPGEAHSLDFTIGGLEEGTHQGYLRIVGSDGLAQDDTRYFTVQAKPAWKILVAAPPPAEDQALYLTEALAPAAWRATGQARFECDVVPFAKLGQPAAGGLDGYAAVALLDPPPLVDAVWHELGGYAEAGGGVAIFLGPRAQTHEAFNRPAPQELLPGPLQMPPARYPDGDLFLTTDEDQHPLVARFRPLRGSIPWASFPVYRYWRLDQPASGVATIIAYRNGHPALLERPLGKGRVLTMTTPVSEGPEISEDNRWNRLPTGFEPWPFVMLADQIFLYLVGSRDERLNYFAGETALLRLAPDRHYATYLLSTPRGDVFRQPADPEQNSLIVTVTDHVGNYRVRAGGAQLRFDRGFSVNLPVAASELARISEEELRKVFGDVEFRLARKREELEGDVSTVRVGRELFPYLIILLALVLGLEHVLANRFYRDKA